MDLLTKIKIIFSEVKKLNIRDVMHSTVHISDAPVQNHFFPKKNLQKLLKKEQNCDYTYLGVT